MASGTSKKVIVTTGIAERSTEENIVFARGVKQTCANSLVYQGSPRCQAAMARWMAATDALEAQQGKIKAKVSAVKLAVSKQATYLIEFTNGAVGFAVAVQIEAKDNPKVALEMGMPLRAEPEEAPEPTTPTDVAIVQVKSTKQYRLAWGTVPGAVVYTAQWKVAIAGDDAWTTLRGRGAKRDLPQLVLGETYAFRVNAIGLEGDPTDWSEIALFVAK